MISLSQVIFYVFATLVVISAVIVVTVKHPVRSVLSLVVTFFAMTGIWMLLHAEFLSLILLLVYVGAVMTLFLFVVMMLNVEKESGRSAFVRYFPVGLIVVLIGLGLILIALSKHYFILSNATLSSQQSNIQQLGEVLYTSYAYPFEIAGVVLLVAIIAAISLTHRGPHKRLVQNITEQINVRTEDRVRLINLPTDRSYPKLDPPSSTQKNEGP